MQQHLWNRTTYNLCWVFSECYTVEGRWCENQLCWHSEWCVLCGGTCDHTITLCVSVKGSATVCVSTVQLLAAGFPLFRGAADQLDCLLLVSVLLLFQNSRGHIEAYEWTGSGSAHYFNAICILRQFIMGILHKQWQQTYLNELNKALVQLSNVEEWSTLQHNVFDILTQLRQIMLYTV